MYGSVVRVFGMVKPVVLRSMDDYQYSVITQGSATSILTEERQRSVDIRDMLLCISHDPGQTREHPGHHLRMLYHLPPPLPPELCATGLGVER